ncbi:peptide ABC transporter substrate-binding protein [Croceicoccus bisphenolivorans]|uniref:peptide ABC transporter substrate-binding protein n=1 Tax=Croceicoccus bisphenolivorans TaxID=1783232 RepID=UPI00083603B7|nr:peptide ABC transporter substrate-binding protein [Croceicoccus bisphenolivorans]
MKLVRHALLVLMLGLGLSACGDRERATDTAAREGVLLWGNGTEPKGLDPHLVTGVPENHIISSLIEGLIAYHPDNDMIPAPGMAESWEHDGQYTVWTFHLRDAKWTNGDPVVAGDFVYSWHRALIPELGNQYAEIFYVMKGAQAFNEGKTKDFSTVGVKALDDKTLQVTLNGPAPYFPNMLKHYSWFPVNPRAVEEHGGMADRQSGWSTLENYVGNGPFRLKKWVTNQEIEVERSPTYWDAKTVKLNGIRFFPIENAGTEEVMFRGGRLHLTNNVLNDKVPVFKKKMPDELKIEPYLGNYYYKINVERKPFNDPRVRKALALAIDRKLLVEKVTKGGQLPGTGFVPAGVPGYPPSDRADFHPEEARKLLAEAGYPNGKGFPKTEILVNTLETHRQIAEALQAMWKEHLNVDIGIYNQEWKVYLNNVTNGDYDMARAGWIGDYVDPSAFLNIMTTGNGNNDTNWGDPRYDALIRDAQRAPDEKTRFAMLREAEQIMMDAMPVIPIYFYTRVYLKDPRLKGWHPKLLDNHPQKYLYFEEQGQPAPAE